MSCKYNSQDNDAQISIPTEQERNTVEVTFYNHTPYRCILYKNVNPTFSWINAEPVADILDGQSVSVMLPPSENDIIGDIFYVHYYVLLADKYETQEHNVFIPAEQDILNISFVLEDGKSYLKSIPKPEKGQLHVRNIYIRFSNDSSETIELLQGNVSLTNLATHESGLHSDKIGIYELVVMDTSADTATMSVFYINSAKSFPFPEFTIERGKLYSFSFNGSSVVKTDEKNIVN